MEGISSALCQEFFSPVENLHDEVQVFHTDESDKDSGEETEYEGENGLRRSTRHTQSNS